METVIRELLEGNVQQVRWHLVRDDLKKRNLQVSVCTHGGGIQLTSHNDVNRLGDLVVVGVVVGVVVVVVEVGVVVEVVVVVVVFFTSGCISSGASQHFLESSSNLSASKPTKYLITCTRTY